MNTTKTGLDRDGIYYRDLVDLIVVLVQAEASEARIDRLRVSIAAALPSYRVAPAEAVLDDMLQRHELVRWAGTVVSLTDAGFNYLNALRFPEGIPPAARVALYPCEELPPNAEALSLRDIHILAVLASFNDELTYDQIVDELHRRLLGDYVFTLPGSLHALRLRGEISTIGYGDETRFWLSAIGKERHQDALRAIVPRASLREEEDAAILTLADLRRIFASPILRSETTPHRIADAIEHAAEQLILDIGEALNAANAGDTGFYDEHLAMLPAPFADKYDGAFLARFLESATGLLERLRTETNVSARSVAEALALRDIVRHAQDVVRLDAAEEGTYPLSRRERSYFMYLDAHVWEDKTFEALYRLSDNIEETIALSKASNNLPDLAFDDWFQPFSAKQKRIAERYQESSRSFISAMEAYMRASVRGDVATLDRNGDGKAGATE